MVAEVRIYIEGGGDGPKTKRLFREGFSQFLSPLRDLARNRRVDWNPIICGGRQAAFDAFRTALKGHPDALNVLLVDAEAPVTRRPWRHLRERDGWKNLGASDDQCHLMVQAMEAWLIADVDALKGYYGQKFNPNPIPKIHDVETIPKEKLSSALKHATRQTQKGEYHKIRHGPAILARLDATKVRTRAQHCDRLFTKLEKLMAENT